MNQSTFNAVSKGSVKKKVHRHSRTPAIATSSHPLVKAYINHLSFYQLDKDRRFTFVRANTLKQRRVRSDFEGAVHAIMAALISRADFNLASEFLFEVRASITDIARIANVHQVYEKKENERYPRVAINRALRAVNLLEELGYLVVQRGYNIGQKKNFPARIWLTPLFFYAVGINKKKLKTILKKSQPKGDKAKLQVKRNKARQSAISNFQHNVALFAQNFLAELKKSLFGNSKKYNSSNLNSDTLSAPKRKKSPYELFLSLMSTHNIPSFVEYKCRDILKACGKMTEGSEEYYVRMRELVLKEWPS